MIASAPDVDAMADAIAAGAPRALARGLTWVEAGGPRAEALCARLYPRGGRAHVVGITGSPGGGKSTLVRALARAARARDQHVGIVAVDPSSPFSGGAILGDRIRMNDLALDPGVFIRSMATRGALGGLARATADAVDLMDAAGWNPIFVETVGVGQDEVDVMRVAETVIVVSVPGLGDDVQALKAGILEIADVHVVNKADRDGADRTQSDLRAMLHLLPHVEGAWVPPILPTVAAREEGIDAVVAALDAHRADLAASGEGAARRRRNARARMLQIAQGLLADAMSNGDAGEPAALVEDVARRALAPHAAARMLLTMARAPGLSPARAPRDREDGT
jgi:LAO/AO transport system kinase